MASYNHLRLLVNLTQFSHESILTMMTIMRRTRNRRWEVLLKVDSSFMRVACVTTLSMKFKLIIKMLVLTRTRISLCKEVLLLMLRTAFLITQSKASQHSISWAHLKETIIHIRHSIATTLNTEETMHLLLLL